MTCSLQMPFKKSGPQENNLIPFSNERSFCKAAQNGMCQAEGETNSSESYE